jgi:hypothetical protein
MRETTEVRLTRLESDVTDLKVNIDGLCKNDDKQRDEVGGKRIGPRNCGKWTHRAFLVCDALLVADDCRVSLRPLGTSVFTLG